MDTGSIELIHDVPMTKPLDGAKVKNMKKINRMTKTCVFFKDMECRAPVCDMEVCQKCSEGYGHCTRVALMKSMIQRVLLLIVSFLLFSELL
jgi:hypothetical protein